MLVDIYYQEDQFRNSANAYIEDSLGEKVLDARIKFLSKAKASFDKAMYQFGSQAGDKATYQFGSQVGDQVAFI